MRKLLCLLSTVLWLLSCNDVDEFGQMLPDSVALDEVKPVSELTYEELETLVADEGLREEMRRNGGLVVEPTVVTRWNNQTYNDMYVYYSDSESGLPPFNQGQWNTLTGTQSANNRDDGFVYVPWYDDEQRRLLPGRTIYCMVGLGLWDGEQKPGFVDKIQDGGGYYANDEIFSEVRSYVYPEAPLISEFVIDEDVSDVIQASFRIVMPTASSEMPECGLCFSATNPLPTVETDAVADADENFSGDGMYYYPYVTVQAAAGTYYVRAFVRGEGGAVSYSPVRRAACRGLTASTRIEAVTDVSTMGYNALTQYLSAMEIDEGMQNRIRHAGGLLILTSFETESSVGDAGCGLTAVTHPDDLPQGSGIAYGGADPLLVAGTESGQGVAVYWHPAEYYSVGDTATTFYYQSGVVAYGPTATLWAYSDVQSYTMTKPIVTNFSIESYGASWMNISWYVYWGYADEEWTAGICYSTATDLPTVEDQVVMVEDGVFDINWETPLEPGTYYFRFFVRTARGIGYSPVQQITITETMTR